MSEVKNIHVCLVTISLGIGGAQRVVAAQTHMFSALGYRVTTAVLRDPIDYECSGELLHLGGKIPSAISSTSTPSPANESNKPATKSWQRLWRLYRFITQNRPDVIIDHRARTNIVKEWVYRKLIYRKTRVIYVCHSAHAPIYLTNVPSLFSKITARSSVYVGVSRYITEQMMPKYGLNNGQYLPNFISPSWLKNSGRSTPIKPPYLLWYGRLDESVKNVGLLLEAFAQSTVKTEGYQLIILGSGPDAELLKDMARALSIESSVVFMPFEPNPQAIITGAKCVCLTSYFEGFPMALLESLSLGTPVVSLDIVSGPSELIQDYINGLLVRERNSRNFAQAIDTLCLDPTLYKKVRAEAQLSVSAYSAQHLSQKWNTLIEDE